MKNTIKLVLWLIISMCSCKDSVIYLKTTDPEKYEQIKPLIEREKKISKERILSFDKNVFADFQVNNVHFIDGEFSYSDILDGVVLRYDLNKNEKIDLVAKFNVDDIFIVEESPSLERKLIQMRNIENFDPNNTFEIILDGINAEEVVIDKDDDGFVDVWYKNLGDDNKDRLTKFENLDTKISEMFVYKEAQDNTEPYCSFYIRVNDSLLIEIPVHYEIK